VGGGLIEGRAAAVRRVARVLAALLIAAGPVQLVAQTPGDTPSERLTPAERRLLAAWPAGERGYDAAPAWFRDAFDVVTSRLAELLLSDPENGEVLGAALDLVEAVEPLDRQPAAETGRRRVAVRLAAGARDRLRRSAEFERVELTARSDRVTYRHTGPPEVVVEGDAAGERAVITITSP
jgi:hypothetical protein